MFKIAILTTVRAFLPEAEAYRVYFEKKGFSVSVIDGSDYDPASFDAVILFHGFHPFWKTYSKVVIGEYHSLSTGRFNRIKDLFKRVLNTRADILIFLNENTRRRLWFSPQTNFFYRPMGFFVQRHTSAIRTTSEYDVIYAGSIRPGVAQRIIRLADMGLRIAVAGNTSPITHRNIAAFGSLKTNQVYELMARCRLGLNYTPDISPLNEQDSTKVIEYCSLGLGIITNKYRWINEFEQSRGGRFLDVESVKCADEVLNFDFVTPSVSDLSWACILERSGIAEALLTRLSVDSSD